MIEMIDKVLSKFFLTMDDDTLAVWYNADYDRSDAEHIANKYAHTFIDNGYNPESDEVINAIQSVLFSYVEDEVNDRIEYKAIQQDYEQMWREAL